MAKIDVELTVPSAGILQIIRDGHYLALCDKDMNVFVLRHADGRYPDDGGLPVEGDTLSVWHVAEWIDKLLGGRPVAGYGSRQTLSQRVQVEVVRATPDNG